MRRNHLDVWCERGILGLVLLILVFGPLATGAVRPLEFLIIQGMATGILLVWYARLWANPQPEVYWPPVCWGVTAFVLYAVGRCQYVDIEYVARQELIRILVYAVLFFAIVNNLRRIEYAQIITLTLMSLAAVLCFFAAYQFVTHYEKIWHFVKPAGYLNRGSGTYINPNHFAGFLEMVLPLGLASALTSRLGLVPRIVAGYSTVVLLIGIGVSGSRGAWIATALMVLVFLAVVLFQSRLRLAAVLGLVVIASATGYFFARFGVPSLRLDQGVVQGYLQDARSGIWQSAWRMWQDHFWWGAGPGHFDYLYPQYRPPTYLAQMQPAYVHNDYLNTLADWGLIGALSIAASWLLLSTAVFKTWRTVRRAARELPSNKLSLLLGAGSAALAMLIHSFMDFNLQIPANAVLLVALMALLSAQFRDDSRDGRITLGIAGRTVVGLVLVAGTAYLGWQEWRKANEYVWLQRAEVAKKREDLMEARIALEKAFRAEPQNFATAYAIGEIFRAQSWAGNNDYLTLAESAMAWLQRAMALNPHDALTPARIGMCLDWIGKPEAASAYFERADKLDPNGYYGLALQGWHRWQSGDYADAKRWLERSLELNWAPENPIAAAYLDLVNRKLAGTGSREEKTRGN